MAGSAYVLASLTPCVLHCVKVRDAKMRKPLSPDQDGAQEFIKQNCHDEVRTDNNNTDNNTWIITSDYNDRKTVVVDHQLFVSTI